VARLPSTLAAAVLVLAAGGAMLPAAHASAASVEERMVTCLACHGASGQSVIPETPSLGGQPAFFVMAQLVLFKQGTRNSAIMTEAVKPLANADIREIAERVARLAAPSPPDDPPDPARAERGRALAARHHCVVCHNPDFSGREQMPRLANQREDYLVKAMREYKSGTRVGWGGTMAQELVPLSDADLVDLAHFLARLPRPSR
jgi:cytochrome c553